LNKFIFPHYEVGLRETINCENHCENWETIGDVVKTRSCTEKCTENCFSGKLYLQRSRKGGVYERIDCLIKESTKRVEKRPKNKMLYYILYQIDIGENLYQTIIYLIFTFKLDKGNILIFVSTLLVFSDVVNSQLSQRLNPPLVVLM